MIMIIPQRHRIQPGETIISWVARLRRLSPFAYDKQYFEAIFGSPRVRLHTYLPAHIGTLADATGVQPMDLLNGHTLYPLFKWFGLDERGLLKQAMLSDHGEKVIVRAKLPHAKVRFFEGLKYCCQCVIDDRNALGFSYYRVEHQIPGVEACCYHGCLLQGIESGDYGFDRHPPLVPEGGAPICASELQAAFARFSLSTLELSSKLVKPVDYQRVYSRALSERNLLTAARHIRLNFLFQLLKETYSDLPFGSVFGIPHALDGFLFVGPLLREKTHFHCHPTKHLLLAFALFDGKADQYQVFGRDDYSKSDERCIPKPAVVDAVLQMLRDGVSMMRIQAVTGRSQCYVRRICELNGIDHLSNSQRFSDETKASVLEKAYKGQHREGIASELSVSVGYVEQIISNTPGLTELRKCLRHDELVKEAFDYITAIRLKYPEWRRKEIKQHCEKYYFRLYHHDKALLESLLPPKTHPCPPVKDWSIEDRLLASRIRQLDSAESLTISAIDHLIDGGGFLIKYLSHLPETRVLLKDLRII